MFNASFFKIKLLLGILLGIILLLFCTKVTATNNNKHIIIIIWDGLRPDSVTEKNTPHLYTLLKKSVVFQDHHAIFPTVTIINAASLASGRYPGATGFFGNTLWQPGAKGRDRKNNIVDFRQPVFTDDDKILQDLSLSQPHLTLTETLFEIAKKHGIKTAFVGNAGARFLADPTFPDMNKHAPEAQPIYFLRDGVTPNPLDTHGATYFKTDNYFTKMYLDNILPKQKPQLSVFWLAEPDGTEHDYGFGIANYFSALKHNDAILGRLQNKLQTLGWENNTDILVISDHAQSFISGSLTEYPLRKIKNHQITSLDKNGYSVSGDVRAADLLTKAGFHAYDGEGCRFDPVMSGISNNGNPVYPILIDRTGKICGKAGEKYTTPSYKVPTKIPQDAVVIATNSSSEYFYIPSHDKKLVAQLVRLLQSHEFFGAIFINTKKYSELPGTLSLDSIHLQSITNTPDLIVSLNYDAKTKINGIIGTEFCDYPNERGTHGSFSPIDVHNFFIASGPDFRDAFQNTLPTSTLDIAPTIAAILHLPFLGDGRILQEALKNNFNKTPTVEKIILASEMANHLKITNTLNQPRETTQYKINLHIKKLNQNNKIYTYFDEAEAVRS